SAEVIQPGFGIAFFARELVGVGITVRDRDLASIRVIVGLLLDSTHVTRNDACGSKMIGEVVLHRQRSWDINTGYTLPCEVYVLAQVGGSQRAFVYCVSAQVGPVQGTRAPAELLYTAAVAVIDVGPTG